MADGWNGRSWSVQPSHVAYPPLQSFTAVACTSPNACTATGSGETGGDDPPFPIVARWNGKNWSAKDPAITGEGSVISGVSCTTDARCTAVGTQYGPFGDDPPAPLAERWQGDRWSIQRTVTPANPPGTSQNGAHATGSLNSVSCLTPSACTAVGDFSTPSGQSETLIERYR